MYILIHDAGSGSVKTVYFDKHSSGVKCYGITAMYLGSIFLHGAGPVLHSYLLYVYMVLA